MYGSHLQPLKRRAASSIFCHQFFKILGYFELLEHVRSDSYFRIHRSQYCVKKFAYSRITTVYDRQQTAANRVAVQCQLGGRRRLRCRIRTSHLVAIATRQEDVSSGNGRVLRGHLGIARPARRTVRRRSGSRTHLAVAIVTARSPK